MADQLEPEGGPRRVYTDERLPGIEIHNDGGAVFQVIDMQAGEQVDEFKAVERVGVYITSEPFAQRRAQEYFDRMAEGEVGSELQARDEPAPAKPATRQLEPKTFNRLQWQPTIQQGQQGLGVHPTKGKLGDPLSGMTQMTRSDVDRVMAMAAAERDPAKALSLRRQALSMMQQEESVAQRVVRVLLSL